MNVVFAEVHLKGEGFDAPRQDCLHALEQIFDDGECSADVLLRVAIHNRVEVVQLDFVCIVPEREHRAVE